MPGYPAPRNHLPTGDKVYPTTLKDINLRSAMVTALVTAVAVVDVIAAAASASAEPDGTMTVTVLKYPTPENIPPLSSACG